MPFNTALTRKLGIRGVNSVTIAKSERVADASDSSRGPGWHAGSFTNSNGVRSGADSLRSGSDMQNWLQPFRMREDWALYGQIRHLPMRNFS